MFFGGSLFRGFNETTENSCVWHLKPKKYPEGSRNNFTGRVLLPQYILEILIEEGVSLPYTFEISHENEIFKTKCSVSEFTGEENEIIIPKWIWEQLNLETSTEVILSYTRIPAGKTIKLLPHTVDFLQIDDPRSELEVGLNQYPCLSLGDEIAINFRDFPNFMFTVTEVSPDVCDSIYTVDRDLNVEFEEPIGYQQKVESERTVTKYLEMGKITDNVIEVKCNGCTLFTDFDQLSKEFNIK